MNIFLVLGFLVTMNGQTLLMIQDRVQHATMASCTEQMISVNSSETGQVAACVQRTQAGAAS